MTELNPFQHIALAHLAASPTNPRKTFADLAELAQSIREQGVMQPILCRVWPDDYPTPEGRAERPQYEIIAGERRYRAAQLAGLTEIPALIRPLNTRQVLEAQIVENLQRRDVTALEEAEGYDLMMREHGYSADEIAEKIGQSRSYVYGRLKLTALCEAVRERYRAGDLDASRALLIARIPLPALQEEAAKAILDCWPGPMSHRNAARHIQERYTLDLTKAPFDCTDPDILPTAGACSACPKRTGNAPELYPNTPADVCTDPTCHAAKRSAHVTQQAERLREAGLKVITGDSAKKIAPHGIYSANIGNEYVALDQKSYYGDTETTARKAIKGQPVETVMIEDVRAGTLVPAVAKKDLDQALAANGFHVSKSTRDPRDLAREKARKAEVLYRRALFDAHHAAARTAINTAKKPALKRDDLVLIARQFWASRGNYACIQLARIYIPDAPERGPNDPEYQDDDYRRTRRMITMIDDFSEGQLILFLLDLALIGTLDVPGYLDDISTPLPLLAAAARAGIDAEGMRHAPASAPGKSASPPPQAPPGGEVTAATTQAKPAGPAKQAAPARAVKPAKPKAQAASAASETKAKAKPSGRVAAAGGKDKPGVEPPPYRCPNTPDMLEGASL